MVTILVASFVVFVALESTAGDPVSTLLPPNASEMQREALRAELGLDDPLVVRFWGWLGAALRGDFGISIVYRTPVSDLIVARLGTTSFLIAYTALLVTVFGILLGFVGALSRRLQPFVVALNGALVAVPSYVAASALIAVFAVQLGWFPTSGSGVGLIDQLQHMTLPAIALALGWIAYLSQVTRATVVSELRGEHVEAARGRGISPGSVFRRHVLRNAAGPIVTAAGPIAAYLVTGAVVVETMFGIDGVGSFLVRSVVGKDTSVVLAINVFLIIIFVLVTTTVEAFQRLVDPRIAGGKGA